jgi:hypothetical protein
MRDFDRMTKLEGCIGVGEGGDELEEGQMVAALCRGVLTRLRLSWGPLQQLWGDEACKCLHSSESVWDLEKRCEREKE